MHALQGREHLAVCAHSLYCAALDEVYVTTVLLGAHSSHGQLVTEAQERLGELHIPPHVKQQALSGGSAAVAGGEERAAPGDRARQPRAVAFAENASASRQALVDLTSGAVLLQRGVCVRVVRGAAPL